MRPPGHHAKSSEAGGFCIFNNVAIAAKYAMEKFGLRRVLIVDWDIHHGDGIQDTFYDDRCVLYISLHRHDNGLFFPEDAPKDYFDVGTGSGLGFTVNIPFSGPGIGDDEYINTFAKVVMPIAYEFSPELVLVASGFDAGLEDPLGECKLSPLCFAQMTHQLGALANGRVIVSLEGGYNLSTVANGVSAVVETLLDHRVARSAFRVTVSSDSSEKRRRRMKVWDTLRRVCTHQSDYWQCLHGFQRHLGSMPRS